MLTAAFLIAVVTAVITVVTDPAGWHTVSILTPIVVRRAGRSWSPAQVFQLVRLIATVIITIAHEVLRDTATILTRELVLLTGLVCAALLITAVPTVVSSVTPNRTDAVQFLCASKSY